MTKVDFRTKTTSVAPKKATMVLNLQKGMQTQFQTDKSDSESFQLLKNLYHKGGNAVLRRGYSLLKDLTGTQTIGIYEKSNGNLLVAGVNDTTNTKIQSINRTTGTATDLITGLTGQLELSMTSLRGALFCTNRGDTNIYYHDGTSAGTIAFDYGAGAKTPKLLAHDEKRVWAVSSETPEEILTFSNDRGTGAVSITTFNAGASTNINRAGVASSRITSFTALLGVGKSVVACGRNKVEVFKIPDFASVALTTFPADVPLSIASYDNVGVENQNAIVAIGAYAYLIGTDGILYRLDTVNGGKKLYQGLERTMKQYDFANASIGYDQSRNLIYISCKNLSDYDTTIVFNVVEENFAIFDNIWAKKWAFDKDNVYFLAQNTKIFDAFVETQLTDNGQSIEWEIQSQAGWAGSLEFYKKAVEMFVHILIWQDTPIAVEFIADRGIDATATADKTISLSADFVLSPFSGNPQNWGQGIYGGSQTQYAVGNGTEIVYNSEKINIPFARYELKLSGSSTDKLEIKGVGIKFITTMRKIKTLTFNS